jgi:hypothetical protein
MQDHHFTETASHSSFRRRRRYLASEKGAEQRADTSEPEDPGNAVFAQISVFIVGVGIDVSINDLEYYAGGKSDL